MLSDNAFYSFGAQTENTYFSLSFLLDLGISGLIS